MLVAVILTDRKLLTLDHFPFLQKFKQKTNSPGSAEALPFLDLPALEKSAIQQALENTTSHLQAAQLLNISRHALERRLKKYNFKQN